MATFPDDVVSLEREAQEPRLGNGCVGMRQVCLRSVGTSTTMQPRVLTNLLTFL